MSYICINYAKQMILRTKRLIYVRKVRCSRSILRVLWLSGLYASGSRCRVYAPHGAVEKGVFAQPPYWPVRRVYR